MNPRANPNFSKRAFSLVEVTMAISIVAFCLIPALGLLPIGLMSNQNALEQTVAASLATAVAADLLATPASATAKSPIYNFNIPAADGASDTTARSLFVSEDGTVVADARSARYRLSVWFFRPQQGEAAATTARILLSWPAAADANLAVNPTKFSGAFEAMITLDRN